MKRTIWVKEFGSLTVEKIRQYFFGDIDTKKFISTDVIGDNDLIIFS